MADKIHRNSLQPGHKLHWYRIEKILGQGGFGITYLAHDFNLDRKVAIKEYLPIELAVREGDHSIHPVSEDRGKQFKWGLDRFLSEAQTLAQFKHPNIVQVHAVFEENNTGYMVMAYEHGQTLQEKLKGKKTLEESELLKILIPILGGLEQVHKAGFIHRDIKPDNIFIRNDGSPVLLDFGSARQALGEQTKTLTSLVSPGYAPYEQYYSKSNEQGPWTDIYGLGATIYRAISGVPPMDAVDRSKTILRTSKDPFVKAQEIGNGIYSKRFLAAIDHALQFKQEDRPQTIKEWIGEFSLPDEFVVESISGEDEVTQLGNELLKKRRHYVIFLCVLLLGFGISVVGIFFYQADTEVSHNIVISNELTDEEKIKQANEVFVAKQYTKAIPLLNDLAEKGYPDSQLKLGILYAQGFGVERDFDKGIKLIKDAVVSNYIPAYAALAEFYIQGWGVQQDYQKAASLLQKGADVGDGIAQLGLGTLYLSGYGVQKDEEKACTLFKRSSLTGNLDAQLRLAMGCILPGVGGMPQDIKFAIQLLEKSANAGHADSLAALGVMYLDGIHFPKDIKKGKELLEKAAFNGSQSAVTLLDTLDVQNAMGEKNIEHDN